MRGLGLGPLEEDLPYDDFPDEYKRAIIGSVQQVWKEMVADGFFAGKTLAETDITKELVRRLNLQLVKDSDPPGLFSQAYFQDVVRGGEVESFDGSHPEKRPDLTFRLCERLKGIHWPDYRAIFVECKIVRSPDKTLKFYGSDGIRRFVEGEYSWAMPTAMMIGYVYGGMSIDVDLSGYLSKTKKLETKSGPRMTGFGVYETIHARPKVTLLKTDRSLITVLHVWLDT